MNAFTCSTIKGMPIDQTNGETIDWISIYKHGDEGEAEHPLKYAFVSFFREDPKTVFKELMRALGFLDPDLPLIHRARSGRLRPSFPAGGIRHLS
jgi:hypothetical protein